MAGIDKVDVLQTLAKCAADTENNAQSIQDCATTLALKTKIGELTTDYEATIAGYEVKLTGYETKLTAFETTTSNLNTKVDDLKQLVEDLVTKNRNLADQVGPATTTSTRTTTPTTTKTTVTTVTTVTTTTRCSDHKLRIDAESGWHHVFELEDDRSVNDMPDSYAELSKPYKNKNAFFIGHSGLKDLPEIANAELCHGPSAGNLKGKLACIPIKEANVGVGIVNNKWAGSRNIGELCKDQSKAQMRIKQMLACLAGTCLGNAYAEGFFWETDDSNMDLCATKSVGTWSGSSNDRPKWSSNGQDKVWCKPVGTWKGWNVPLNGKSRYSTGIGTQGNGDYGNHGNQGFHVWSNGITLYVPGSSFGNHHEFDETNDERIDGANNRLVLRVKFKKDQCITW